MNIHKAPVKKNCKYDTATLSPNMQANDISNVHLYQHSSTLWSK